MRKVYLKDVKDKINNDEITAYIEFLGHNFKIESVSPEYVVRTESNGSYFRSFYCSPYTVVLVES